METYLYTLCSLNGVVFNKTIFASKMLLTKIQICVTRKLENFHIIGQRRMHNWIGDPKKAQSCHIIYKTVDNSFYKHNIIINMRAM